MNYKKISARILSQQELAEATWYLRLRAEENISSLHIEAGQFVMIRVSRERDPLLNRPFSISGYNWRERSVDILYRVRGKGTKLLSRKAKGALIDMILPLGQPFPFPKSKDRHLTLVAGGIGIAPILAIGKVAATCSHSFSILWGIKHKSEYFKIGSIYPEMVNIPVLMASEDGSIGIKGTVVHLLREYLEKHRALKPIVVSCGPLPMLKTVNHICRNKSLTHYVSMEARMGCGMGYCLGCAIPSIEGGYHKVCKEGPIFDANVLDWKRLGNGH